MTDDLPVLSRPRLLALCTVLGAALILFFGPAALAIWSMLDSAAVDRAVGQLQVISNLANAVELGRLSLLVVLIGWLVRSPNQL